MREQEAPVESAQSRFRWTGESLGWPASRLVAHKTMYNTYIVRRTQIYLDDQQDRRLTERSREAGRTKSALIRDAVDAYLTPASRDDEALARLRAAITIASGAARHLPVGSEYVEDLRAIEAERQRAHDRRR
jgi:predicted DNA-binding protein